MKVVLLISVLALSACNGTESEPEADNVIVSEQGFRYVEDCIDGIVYLRMMTEVGYKSVHFSPKVHPNGTTFELCKN